jgi:hypothetical protein
MPRTARMVSGPLLLLGLALPEPYGAGTACCRGFSDIQAPAMIQELIMRDFAATAPSAVLLSYRVTLTAAHTSRKRQT